MKYFLFAALALVGCTNCASVPQHTNSVEEPSGPPSLNQVVLGFNATQEINYDCKQQEVNPALVWDQCEFRNRGKTTKQMCLQLSYQSGSDVIATSRVICSGQVYPNESRENFAAFTAKNGRDRLEQSCGSNMINCTLTAREVVQ